MTDFLVEMEWSRCIHGYQLVPNSPEQIAKGEEPEIIEAKSNWVCDYRPFEKYYSAFAKIRSKEQVVAFVNKFGPLGYGTSIKRCLEDAEFFRLLLSAKQSGPRKVWSNFREQSAVRYVRNFNRLPMKNPLPTPTEMLRRLDDADLGWDVGRVSLEPDNKRGVRIVVAPASLMSGLWIQLARKLTGHAIMRTCRYCGSLFEAGPGTKTRADATFCCNKHSIKFHSVNRSKRG